MNRDCHGLFQELRAYKRSRALVVAFSCGLVDALACDGKTTRDAAAVCGMSEEWASSLLRILADLEVVEKVQEIWKLTCRGRNAVADGAFRAFAGYHLHCYEAWLDLPARCFGNATGPGFHRRAAANRAFVHAYLDSMDVLAQQHLSFLKQHCRMQGTILDVGAGPSTFCRSLARDDNCRVTAMDLPPIVEEARKLFDCPEGFEWVASDFRGYFPEQRFDALFCSHLLEYASAMELPQWLARLGTFVRPGGTGVFLTFLRGTESNRMAQLNLFELSTGVNGDRLGHICTPDELQKALQTAGASGIACKPLPEGPSYSEWLVTCTWSHPQNPANVPL